MPAKRRLPRMKKRYLRKSAVDTWKLASYVPKPALPPEPEPPKPRELGLERRIWNALRRL